MIKTNTKTLIIILVTLIIGSAIGFEVSEILIKKRFDEFRNIRQPRGMVDIFSNIIKPDEKQKPKIDSIIFSFHNRVDKIMNESRKKMDKQLDTLRLELKPYLNDDQMKRFDDEIKRIKMNVPNDSTRKGPPEGILPNGPQDMKGKDFPQRREGENMPPEFDGKNPPPGFDGKNPPPEFDGKNPPPGFDGKNPPPRPAGDNPPPQFEKRKQNSN